MKGGEREREREGKKVIKRERRGKEMERDTFFPKGRWSLPLPRIRILVRENEKEKSWIIPNVRSRLSVVKHYKAVICEMNKYFEINYIKFLRRGSSAIFFPFSERKESRRIHTNNKIYIYIFFHEYFKISNIISSSILKKNIQRLTNQDGEITKIIRKKAGIKKNEKKEGKEGRGGRRNREKK